MTSEAFPVNGAQVRLIGGGVPLLVPAGLGLSPVRGTPAAWQPTAAAGRG
jgi:hypothetical protein